MQRIEENNDHEFNKKETSKVVEHLIGASGAGCPIQIVSNSSTLPANCVCNTGLTYQPLTSNSNLFSCQ